jgi:ABC-2 type transport system ATP-binding protein
MRGLLRDFADRGGSVLLSSHLLREIEVIADELVVIGGGAIVARGAKRDLLAAEGNLVRATDDQVLSAALAAAGIAHTAADGGGLVVREPAERIAVAAATAGVVVIEIRPADAGGLEELFLRLTADHARDDIEKGTRS